MDCYFAGHTRPTVARHPVDWQAAAAARNKSMNCAAQIGGSFGWLVWVARSLI